MTFAAYLFVFLLTHLGGLLLADWHEPGRFPSAPGCYKEIPESISLVFPIDCEGFNGSRTVTALMNFPLVFETPMRAFDSLGDVFGRPLAVIVMALFWIPLIHAAVCIIEVQRSRRKLK